ncbi:MAG: carboxypeptidase-like regulatory domain-containing protein [Bacteroidota bacterium]
MKRPLYFHTIFLLLNMLLAFGLQAQQRYTISGYVEDAASGEKILSARVFDELSKKGAITNNYGFFSITLPEGKVELSAGFVGFETQTIELTLDRDTSLTFRMAEFSLETVEIVAEEQERIEQKTEMSTIDLPIQQVKMLPALLGEVDVIKAIQLMPGVQSGSEASTGLYVRGGGPDQNLILLDGVPLYYVSHLGGFFSVFNADALSSVKLIKGGFPARYGGRLSSVLDVRMKEGNMNKFQGEGSIGLISSKLSIQGPINKGKTSFILSGRRTYLDLLTRPISKIASQGDASFGYFFHDINGKINHVFSEKDRLYLSFYVGDDKLSATESYGEGNRGDENYYASSFKTKFDWGNDVAALRWNHIWSPKLFSNLTTTFSKYGLRLRAEEESEYTQADTIASDFFGIRYESNIQDWSARLDFDFYPSPSHDIKFGINSTYHTFRPGTAGYQERGFGDDVDTTFGAQLFRTLESSVYVEDNFKIGSRFSANLGVHGVHYLINDQSFWSLQPRASARLQLGKSLSAKASFAQMTQFIHLLTNSSVGLPIDLWVPATEKVRPQQSWQVAAGLATSFEDGMFELSVEGYYKEMEGLIAYKEGINFFLGGVSKDGWESTVETGGTGQAYGAEILLQKKRGKTTGWVGYTLSWNWRQFENINAGERYPFRYDRRHDISVVVSHQFSDRISVSGTWVFGTGNAVTLATAGYGTAEEPRYGNGPLGIGDFRQIRNGTDEGVVLYENGRNGFRMEDYHRLDLGVNFTKKKKWGERTWSIGVYNAYSRLNPFAYYFGRNYDFRTGDFEVKLKKLALFPIIPSISYQFKF